MYSYVELTASFLAYEEAMRSCKLTTFLCFKAKEAMILSRYYLLLLTVVSRRSSRYVASFIGEGPVYGAVTGWSGAVGLYGVSVPL